MLSYLNMPVYVNMRNKKSVVLPISNRSVSTEYFWKHESFFLRSSQLTRKSLVTYALALRFFADWIINVAKPGYGEFTDFPLDPAALTTDHILDFNRWLESRKAAGTQDVYVSVILSYLRFLDTIDELPEGVQLGKLRQELSDYRQDRSTNGRLTLDTVQDAVQQIVSYYEIKSLPAQETSYNERIILLRNRAIVQVLFATGIDLTNLRRLDRKDVDYGNAQSLTISDKNGNSVELPISVNAQNALRAYLGERNDSNPALFVAHSRNAKEVRLSATSVHNVMKKAVKQLGLPQSISARHFQIAQATSENLPSQNSGLVAEEVQRMFGNVKVTIRLSKLDEQLKEIALYDIDEAKRAFKGSAYKACIVMLGSVLEAIMIGILTSDEAISYLQVTSDPPGQIRSLGLQHPDIKTRIAERLRFEDYKNIVHQLVPNLEKLKVDGIQSFRNSVHPWLSVKDPQVYADPDRARTRAVHFLSSLEILSHSLLTWEPGIH